LIDDEVEFKNRKTKNTLKGKKFNEGLKIFDKRKKYEDKVINTLHININ